jgi:hypothetical protein
MGYRLLTTVVLVVHFGYLAYVILGGFIAWRFTRTIWAHLAAAAWGVVVVAFPLLCPLTMLEDWARQRAGQGPLDRGFIDRYIEGVLYPERYTRLLQALIAVAIAISWAGFILLRRRAARRASRPAPR